MKRHLKASLGLGNFNGLSIGAWQPPNIHTIQAENGSPNKANGNGPPEPGSILLNADESREKVPASGPDADRDDVAESMPKSRIEPRRESNGEKGATSPLGAASAEEMHKGKQRKSTDDGVSEQHSNGHGKLHEAYGVRPKERAKQRANENVEKGSTAANNQQSSKIKSPAAVKPKNRRGRPPKQHTAAKKPRENASLRGAESFNEEDANEADRANPAGENVERLSPEYQPGDLLWSKIGHCPFWPCMVTEDPIHNKYYEQRGTELKYYVQYFGIEVKHGWTQNSNRIIPYRGLEAFKQFAAERIAEAKYKLKFFDVEPKRSADAQNNWAQALREVEDARAFESVPERYKAFRFAFYPGGKKRNGAPPAPDTESSFSEAGSSSSSASSEASVGSSSSSESEPGPQARARAPVKPKKNKNGASKKEDFNNNFDE